MTIPITRYIESKSGSRLVIGEHPDSLFLAMDRSGFFTMDEALEIEAAIRQVRLRLKHRAPKNGRTATKDDPPSAR